MSRYLLDTNILSEPSRPHPHAQVKARLDQHAHQIATASVVWHELLYGLARMPVGARRDFVAHYLLEVIQPVVPVLPFDGVAATWFAHERSRLAAQGQMPSFVDGMIAAIAATQGLILVTRNTRHFLGFNGLIVEDWFS